MGILPYTYTIAKGVEVNQQTEIFLEQNPEIKEKIIQLSWVYHTVGKIVPQTMENWWSGHSFPFRQSWEEIQISQNLCFLGLYKQAFTSLRSALELGLLSVYYNINDDGHNVVQDWLKSRNTFDANTPKAKKIWNILLSNYNIESFNSRFNLRERFDKLTFLHDYVHSKGSKYSNAYGRLKSNTQTFEDDLLLKWVDCLNEIVVIVGLLHILKYPIAVFRFDYSKKFGIDIPSFGGLQEFEIDRIAQILPDGYIEFIEELLKLDSEAQEHISYITSLPDMTEEDVEEQAINIEKFFIPGSGFMQWEKGYRELYKTYIDKPEGEVILKRIEILREWAEENGYMKPKFPLSNLKKQ